MNWIDHLLRTSSAPQEVLILALVAAVGVAAGSLKFRGIGLGIAGVLFAGLVGGHLLHRADIRLEGVVLEFVREFGLILFVYTIGMQVGPGFVDSLRRNGLPLNLMAAAVVVLGLLITVLMVKTGHVQAPIAVGVLSGAVTNTPSLAAARQALRDVPGLDAADLDLPALGYAVAYPFGVIGIILSMLLIKRVARIDLEAEARALATQLDGERPGLATLSLQVTNSNLFGMRLRDVPLLGEAVVVSRIMRGGVTTLATPDTLLESGDVMLAVGPKPALEKLRIVVGSESKLDVRATPSNLATQRVIVTRRDVLGKTTDQLDLVERFGVAVTRISRADIELPPRSVRLQFGDNLVIVGDPAALKYAAAALGNSVKRLNQPQIISLFIGIALGVIAGSIPFHLPGVPAPVKLGMAGGPLIVAILLSRVGHIGPVVWHLPIPATHMLRELGIVLFLACVGIKSGDRFFSLALSSQGFGWMLWGAAITLVPLLAVAAVARAMYKLNYLTLCGLLAGSMTDPPALQFAGSITSSEAPSVAYATVYPLVMLLRVVGAQVLVLMLM